MNSNLTTDKSLNYIVSQWHPHTHVKLYNSSKYYQDTCSYVSILATSNTHEITAIVMYKYVNL